VRLVEPIPILQTAIGPVILISGVALLVGSMNNRLDRTIDRSRTLIVARNRAPNEEERARHHQQLAILGRRAKILQMAITLASISVLSAALLIIVLFTSAVLNLENAVVVIALFAGCLVALIASLIYFIREINMSLHALSLEIDVRDRR
jgi:Na+/melibiose symporter-like transporter